MLEAIDQYEPMEVSECPYKFTERELIFLEFKPDHWTWEAWLQQMRKFTEEQLIHFLEK